MSRRMRWTGTVRGADLEGTMTFWDRQGKAYGYWFKATLKE